MQWYRQVRPLTAQLLFERDRELALIALAARRAAGGDGSVVLVDGPAGVGKTRLLQEATARAEASGSHVLAATGGAVERDLGWGVARALLGSAVGSGGHGWSGAARLALPIFSEAQVVAEVSLGAMLHGLYWMVAQLADEHPLLVVVDDAQWVDAPSLRWLAYIAPRVATLRAVVAIAVRTGEPAAVDELLDVIAATPDAARVSVAPLSREGSGALVDSRCAGADDDLKEACFQVTRGSPFLLRAVLDELRGRSNARATDVAGLRPERVTLWLRRRLTVLSPEAQALAPAIAVLGLSAPLHWAAELSELGEDAAARAADELAQARLLEPGLPLRFVHPLVREVVHDMAGSAQRARTHGRAAALLRKAGARPSEVAVHLIAVEPQGDATVVETLLAAADEAMSRGDPDTTATLMRRALREPPGGDWRGDVMRRLGLAQVALGDREGFTRLEAAIGASRTPVQRARIALQLSRSLRMAAEHRRAVGPLERALADLPADSPLAERVEGELINVSMFDPRVAAAASSRLERFRAQDVTAGIEAPSILANLALWSISSGPGTEPAVSFARRALAALDRREPDPSVLLFALRALACCDQLDEARTGWDAFVSWARDRGQQNMIAFGCLFRAEVNLWGGSLADAEADALEATEAFLRWGGRPLEPVSMLIHAQVERGRTDEAERWLDTVAPPELPALWDAAVLLCARSHLRLVQGRAEEASADALDAGRIMAPYGRGEGRDSPALLPWRSTAAVAMAACGRRSEAQALAGEEVELARRLGARRALGVALVVAALTTVGDERVRGLEESAGVLAGSPARLEYARAVYALGVALRQTGHRDRARERLREALDCAADCGGVTLASDARGELRLAGARPRRDRMSGRDALTAAELRVARLAAEGGTNREIAQRLFLTTRTVETHLTHAYAKLGIRSRAELQGHMPK
jgi:DNA-binding CsgD family transcriptional regulator